MGPGWTVSLQVSGCVRSGGTYDGLDVVRDRGSGGRLCDCLRQERGADGLGTGVLGLVGVDIGDGVEIR